MAKLPRYYSLELASSDTNVLEMHYKNILRSLMKLPEKCPDSVIYFLAGSIPLLGHIHKKQLNLFGMITRLPKNVLHKLAGTILLSERDTTKSWFIGIRNSALCTIFLHPSSFSLNLSQKLLLNHK